MGGITRIGAVAARLVPGMCLLYLGAALLICWDGDHEDFQDSHCAENALDEYGLDEYDRDAVVQQMSAVINELIEQSGAGGNPAYATAKLLFCSLPRSLFGSAATVYDLWCAS